MENMMRNLEKLDVTIGKHSMNATEKFKHNERQIIWTISFQLDPISIFLRHVWVRWASYDRYKSCNKINLSIVDE